MRAGEARVPKPTIVAFPLGSGRVVALADPDVLRTDQMRNCAQGSALSVVRSLEYLTRGRARTLVFAEYYQLVGDRQCQLLCYGNGCASAAWGAWY